MSRSRVENPPRATKNTPRDRSKRDVGKRRHRDKDRAVFGHVHDVMRVTRVQWRFLDPGTVVLARVPFDDREDYKVRPLVVLSADPDGVHGFPCTTSSARRRTGQYVEVSDLGSAGLTRPTRARRTSVTLPLPDVVAVLGVLGPPDRHLVVQLPTGPVAA
jgi:hypothetical protein